jgi:sugar lactone lactonase YvrE
MKLLSLTSASTVLAMLALGVQTRTWTQSDYSEFEKGHREKLSLRGDGRLTLAPVFTERFDSSTPYLWALAQDSKGNLYAGGGPGAKLFRLSEKGGTSTVAELEGLQIQAIAVDRKDRVYAGTSPDGKVYRIDGGRKPEVFYDPKAKYIWALAFNSAGDLFVGTGDRGEIHRVSPDGKGMVFFKTDETHTRSLAVDAQDNLIAGTEPGGLVMRISPKGEGFVLYQIGKKEVTSVAVARDGSVYAAGIGNKTATPAFPALTTSPAPQPVPAPAAAGQQQNQPRPPLPPPPTLSATAGATVTGGSEVWRIDSSGRPRKVWEESRELVYAIAFDSEGRALLGTGNKGYIYRIDSDQLDTALLNAPPTQITALLAGRDGRMFAATGNIGKVYEIGPGLAKEGVIESDVFDADLFSQWGRLTFEGETNGGKIAISTRSGNLDQPQKNWSPWSPAVTSADGARAASPPARFLQWKATLTAGPSGQSPELRKVEVAYLPKNVEPTVDLIEITPPNYRFPAPSATFGSSPQNISLPALGKKRPTPPAVSADVGSAMNYAKGFIGARWSATDLNSDAMVFTVHIRGRQEREWKVLREKVRERHISWDSTSYPDGEYVVRITASDEPGNARDLALSSDLVSDPFTIDNTPPEILELAADRQNRRVAVRWKARDALNNVKLAEYSLDGGDWSLVVPVGGLSDARELEYSLTLDDVAPGEHTIAVRVQDVYDNQSVQKTVIR